jgi:hypothetical protein
MEVLVAFGAWALATLCTSVLPASNSNYGILQQLCGGVLSSSVPNITADLGPKLSNGAQIYLPSSDGFVEGTTRWSSYKAPNITVVVQVANENDVAETVNK